MEIVLLRHGKPDLDLGGRVRASAIPTLLEAYNAASICDSPTPQAVEIARNCKVTVCSDLPRSIDSARALGVNTILQQDTLFREIELPYISGYSPRLSPYTWFLLFRALWFAGMSRNGISVKQARDRAGVGAARLMEISRQYGSVLFVGHGLLNRYISRHLVARGWQGPKGPGSRHWAFGVYRL